MAQGGDLTQRCGGGQSPRGCLALWRLLAVGLASPLRQVTALGHSGGVLVIGSLFLYAHAPARRAIIPVAEEQRSV